jgi:hypothetical protein
MTSSVSVRKSRLSKELLRQIAGELLRNAGFEPAEGVRGLEVARMDYEAYIAVEAALADVAVDERTPELLFARLTEDLGSGEAATKALKANRSVRQQVAKESARIGKPVTPVPDSPPRLEELPRFRGEPMRLSRAEITVYSGRRAGELGFSPAEVWTKGQGKRSERHAALKKARGQIVIELRDRGASLADIGVVFGGRRRESIYELERAARKAPKEDGSNG